MNGLKRTLARLAHACVRLLPSPPGQPREPSQKELRPDARTRQTALASPWRIYRIYARPDFVLLRDEQGQVLELGVLQGNEPDLGYRLHARNLQAANFASYTDLLDDIAHRIESGEIGSELLSLPQGTVPPGIDLDRGTHIDVSMKLKR